MKKINIIPFVNNKNNEKSNNDTRIPLFLEKEIVYPKKEEIHKENKSQEIDFTINFDIIKNKFIIKI